MNAEALRAALVRPVPVFEPYGPADELRRRLVPSYDALRAVQEGERSPYATPATVRAPRGAGTGIEASPRCGDCSARRTPTGPCRACGSTQPPSLAAMNPRAARMIGASPYR